MDLQGINPLDIVLATILIVSTLVGIARGLFREILSLIAWVVALWVAIKLSPQVSENFVKQFIEADSIAYIASFGVIFFAALFAIGLVNLLLTSLFDAVKMGGFNRLMGMVFGFLRGLVIGALVVAVISAVFPNLKATEAWTESKLRDGFENLAAWGIEQIPAEVRKNADTWLNPPRASKDNTLISERKEADVKDNNATSGLTLSSYDENAAGQNTQANRPAISVEQQRRQAERNDAMSGSSETENRSGISLESAR
ncbi:MAG: CvpA family protein [Cardiobacteriaceae bacterium]|nr:CvpA family protein [Cardiobacteriaceae bacterium]